MATYSLVDQGTGELLRYDDPFAEVTPELIARADEVENELRGHLGNLQKTYIQIGLCLDIFDREKLYLAKQCDSFREYAKSPHLGMDYRTAHDLLRIVREALPILMQNDMMHLLPSVSKMRALLPTLADGEETFIKAVEAVQDLTVAASYDAIDEIRGVDAKDKKRKPFRAVVRTGPKEHKVKIYSTNEEDSYTLGFLSVKREEWAAFENMFGSNVEFDIQQTETRLEFNAR